jgi:hypothetical protein
MDTANGFDHDQRAVAGGDTDGAVNDAMFDLGGDERRMHVRAYNHWVSLLKGRPYPPIEDLDPAGIIDFGPHSVLLDFTGGLDDPGIAFLGKALREECGLDAAITRIADVPSRSLLSRLTDHYLQIIANRAPIGFEAEFVGTRGRTTLYRGILMPFSSDGEAIDFIYGVINWKELADAATHASIAAELNASVRAAPPPNDATIWADGPSAAAATDPDDAPSAVDAGAVLLSGSLDERLTLARESAAQVRASDVRSRSALYRALTRAHDFRLAADAEPDSYAALLEEAGLKVQARAPMTPIVKLVFGADHDKTRLTEYAAVLGYARRHAVEAGGLAGFIEGIEGGIKAIVVAERQARRPAGPAPVQNALDVFRRRPVLESVPLAPDGAEFVVLLARANGEGRLDIVARTDARAALDAVIRRAA